MKRQQLLPQIFPSQFRSHSPSSCQQRSLKSPWTIIQCPQCRKYLRKSRQEWHSCPWHSPAFVELCLAQVQQLSTISFSLDEDDHKHPHFTSARQIQLAAKDDIYSNLVTIEVEVECRPCCFRTQDSLGVVTTTTTTAESNRKQIVVKMKYCFDVRHCLCEQCYHHQHQNPTSGPPPKRKDSSVGFSAKKGFGGFLSLRYVSQLIHELILPQLPPPPQKSSLTKRQPTPFLSTSLSDDCIQRMLPYLPVENLFCLLQVSSLWYSRVSRFELSSAYASRQWERVVEAWNHTSESNGVFVNLDHFFSHSKQLPGSERKRLPQAGVPAAAAAVESGGYLQLLPVREPQKVVTPSGGFSFQPKRGDGEDPSSTSTTTTTTTATTTTTFSFPRHWSYRQPTALDEFPVLLPPITVATATTSSSCGSSRSNHCGHHLSVTVFEKMILGCLNPRQAALVAYLRENFTTLLPPPPPSESESESEKEGNLADRYSSSDHRRSCCRRQRRILLPFVVSQPRVVGKTYYYAFHVSFVLSS